MLKRLSGNLLSILLISVVPIVAYWPVSFFSYCMKWDMMDFFFPMRYFLATSLQHHILPLWCPYIFLGNPFYADPQSGLWYPIDVLLAATVGYNVYTVQAEFILHLIIAAAGFYQLLRTLKTEAIPAAMVGALFPLTGFFVSNASHSAFIISVAWIPWIFHFFLQGITTRKVRFFLLTGLALTLCLTGGYVALAVLSGYGLLGLFSYHVLQNRKNFQHVKATVGLCMWSALTFLTLSSGYIYALLQGLPYLKRTDGLDVAAANVNAFTPSSFISFWFPFAVNAQHAFFDTDITMRNGYMGLLVFPLMYIGLAAGNKKRNVVLLLVGLFCLSVAVGSYLPVREWLYYTVPFMKFFRHPAIFRAFTIVSFLIISADGLQVLFHGGFQKVKNGLIAALVIQLLVVLGFLYFGYAHSGAPLSFPDLFSTASITHFNSTRSVSEHILAQAPVQVALLLLGVLLVVLVDGRKIFLPVSIIWMADLLIAAQLNVPGTVISTIPTADFNKACSNLPNHFPAPDHTPIENYNQYGGDALQPVVYNASILRKQPCSDGFNPFYLKQYAQFLNSPLSGKTLKNEIAFLSNRIRPFANLEEDVRQNIMDSTSLYADGTYAEYDTNARVGRVAVTLLEPGNVAIRAVTQEPAYLTLLQSNFPGWQCWIDGSATAIITTNYSFMTIALPPGKHEVNFRFVPLGFYWMAGITLLGYLAFVSALLYLMNKERNTAASNS